LLKLLKNKQIQRLPKRSLLGFTKLFKYEKIIKFQDKIVLSIYMPPFPGKAFDRYLEAAILSKTGKLTPSTVNFAITHRCNYNCWHCGATPKKGEDLSLSLIKDTIKKFQDMGTSIFAITGGEPLLREDLPEIIKSIDDRSSVFMFTTGYGLTEEKAKELKKAGLFGLMISLDHYTPEIHDKLRGFKGAYKNATDAVKIAQKAGLYVGISSLITREIIQKNEILKFLELAQNLQVQEAMMIEPHPTGKLLESDESMLTPEERKQFINFHKWANRKRKYPRVSSFSFIESGESLGCTAGYSYLYIDAEGNIRPCDFSPLLRFGNIKKEKIEDIWKRLSTTFNKPRSFCFVLGNYKTIRERSKDRKTYTPEQSVQVCKNCPSGKIPLFYRKFGVR